MPQVTDVRVGSAPGPGLDSTLQPDYELDAVRAALREVLAPLGGMAAFVKPGERIGLKPNLLLGSDPGQAIITHPVVLAAVALEVREAGATPLVVESPGSGRFPRQRVLETDLSQDRVPRGGR